MEIGFTKAFLRQLKKLEPALQEEICEKVELFQVQPDHMSLKVHKLKGRLKDRYSFSVNYSYRGVFKYTSKTEVVLMAVGDHDVYKQ